MEIVYTVHHCWKALLEEGLLDYCTELGISIKPVGRSKDLPSSSIGPARPGGYALYRVEEVDKASGELKRSTHATSHVFEYLDPKDALYRELLAARLEHLMPPTQLFAWDADISEQRTQDETKLQEFFAKYGSSTSVSSSSSSSAMISPQRLLLKAALGAGGYGLYFVGAAADCWEVIQGHRMFAQRRAGFVEGLERDYGVVPAWSLQSLVQPVRCDFEGQLRKTQIRAYICAVDGIVFVHSSMEVRLPIWEEEEEEAEEGQNIDTKVGSSGSTEADDIEEQLCGKGSALPYNRGRSKSRTMRMMLHEVKELQGSYEALNACALQFAGHLKSKTAAAHALEVTGGREDECSPPSRMAIIGLDLIVSTQSIYGDFDACRPLDEPEPKISVSVPSEQGSDLGKHASVFKAYILEANNNPALPQPEKHRMSAAYRQHMRALCCDLVQLGLDVNGGQVTLQEDSAAATNKSSVHNFFRA
jgi:hypothetical protein